MEAIRDGLVLVKGLYGICISSVKSDCLNAVSMIKRGGGLSSEDLIFSDIVSLLKCGGDGLCYYISRRGNQVAHTLAKMSLYLLFYCSFSDLWGNPRLFATLGADDLL